MRFPVPRRLAPFLLAALAVPVIVAATLMIRARAAGARGGAALSRGALGDAAAEFERALGFRVPGDPAYRRAVDGMRAVAAGQEASGEIAGAWRTLERLQASIRETASFLTREEGVLEDLETDQRRLEARLGAPAETMSRAAGPAAIPANSGRGSAVVLLLGAWVACTFVLGSRPAGEGTRRRWAAASLAAWAAWAVALWLA